MSSIRTIMLSGLLLGGGAAAATELPPVPDLEPPATAAFASSDGWYVRGDVGYAASIDPKVKAAGVPFARERLDKGVSLGGGLGYKFNSWLRADVTGDYYLPRDFRGLAFAPLGAVPMTARVELSSWSLLFNGYADFGTWSGITPYLGAGIGVGQVEIRNHAAGLPDANGGITHGNGRRTSLAWALMAGAAIDITSQLKIDVGYRYSNLGDARAGASIGGARVRFKDVQAHDVRIGLRWMFAEPTAQAEPTLSRLY